MIRRGAVKTINDNRCCAFHMEGRSEEGDRVIRLIAGSTKLDNVRGGSI